MTDERTYDDDEIREIFGRAASQEAGAPLAPAATGGHGLTLDELQAIGREVGIEPARVAEAAAALDHVGMRVARQTMIGAPIGVGRVVDLPRAPTDREWEMLVAELRRTFDAKGKVESYGDLRSWTNSRLHAHIEPSPSGYRLRMGTVKGNAQVLGGLGVAGLVGGLIWMVVLAISGGLAEEMTRPLTYAVLGAGALIANALRLPPWARERERQMEHIAERASLMLSSESPE
jgi:hypothetical protein